MFSSFLDVAARRKLVAININSGFSFDSGSNLFICDRTKETTFAAGASLLTLISLGWHAQHLESREQNVLDEALRSVTLHPWSKQWHCH
jgi:hypothetical protein